MRFAIMGRILDYEGYGMHTMLEGLLKSISDLSPPHEFFLLVGPDQTYEVNHFGEFFEIVTLFPDPRSGLRKFQWDHLSVGQACKWLNIDALYAPAHIRPAYAPCPVVVSVLDMMYHLFPEQWSFSDRLYFKNSVSLLTSRAKAIAALSENTKRDILRFYPIPEEKIVVIYPGVPEGFTKLPHESSQVIRYKYALDAPFILYVGSFHPRKNVLRVIQAFEQVALDHPHHLVMLGPSAWLTPELDGRLRDNPFGARIHRLGLVPRSELPFFYNQSDAFIFPSLYEGFGFPVLEALACGCATITSASSSIPEVAGEACILVDPEDGDEIANAMRILLQNPQLRDTLGERGVLQSQKFSWSETGTKTIALLENAVSNRY